MTSTQRPPQPAAIDTDDSPLSAATAARDQSVLQMVQHAVGSRNVALAYQPVMTCDGTAQPAFYEGLIRIMDDTGRIIPARDFIEDIEDKELGRQIDCLSLEMGMAALQAAPDLRLSINMSARSIGYSRWKRILEDWLRRNDTLAERLILEITESSAMQMPDLVTAFMAELQHKGIAFALDDFGAGYTAFRYLKQFYFDILKIDGQFIRRIHDDPDNQVLARALIGIGQHFDMVTVAEFVETHEEASFLRDAGIDCMQGYYYGAPSLSPPWEYGRTRQKTA
ncbi:EAL domain-containing protein [Actibacterium ureilyticum]|uniref:EAL domain-containing protein n=1 Tax=Actibacterium ureilyticum TaxID=1590614 RepID=UPI000BAAFC21|nr:EAL domain-containing protein [Actibacterium ureilyticum]